MGLGLNLEGWEEKVSVEDEKKHSIDYSFIEKKEGYKKTAYVPKDADGNVLGASGVTIGAGIDLGQRTLEEVEDSGLDSETIEKLKPFIGKKGEDAVSYLKDNPLTLKDDKIQTLQKKVYDKNISPYIDYYEKKTDKKFNDLDPKVQTAIGSVVTQYGPDLEKRTPNFNTNIINDDISGMKKELENFGDDYPTRRKSEASLLENLSVDDERDIEGIAQPEMNVLDARQKPEEMTNKGIQQKLEDKGYDVGSIDGKIGPKTKEQIRKFQKDKGLKVDGIVGKNTWGELLSSLNPFKVEEASAGEIGKLGLDLEGWSPEVEETGKLGLNIPSGWGAEPGSAPDPRESLTLGQKIMTSKPMDMLNNVRKPQKGDTPILERLGKGFGMGVTGMVEGTGGVAKWFGIDGIGDSINKYAKEMKKFYEIPDPNFTSKVASGFGSMATFLIPGLGISRGVAAVSAMPRLAVWLGVSASSVMEAAVEAGGAYNKMVAKGEDHKEASSSATKDFWLNLPVLVFTNKVGIFGENGGKILKGLKSAGSESVQEFTQQIIGNFATKDPLFEGALESAAIGGIVGGGTGMIMSVGERAEVEKIKAKDTEVKTVEEVEENEAGPIPKPMEKEVEGVKKPMQETDATKESDLPEIDDELKKDLETLMGKAEKVEEKKDTKVEGPETYTEMIQKQVDKGNITKNQANEMLKEVKKEDTPSVEVKEVTPKFKSTDEAIEFGQKATPEQIEALKTAKVEQDKTTAEIKKIDDPTDEQMQQGMDSAIKSQYLRESIEASEGKLTKEGYVKSTETPIKQPSEATDGTNTDEKQLESIWNKAQQKEAVKGEGVDVKGIIKDIGEALGGKEGSSELSEEGKTKKQEAQKRLLEKHLPSLVAEAKKRGLKFRDYLKTLKLSDEQIDYLSKMAKSNIPSEPEGKEKVHGLAKSIMSRAVKDGMANELGDLPTYNVRNMEEAIDRAVAFIDNNYDLALKIALGQAQERGDVRASELYTAFSVKAKEDVDIDMIQLLAYTKTALELGTELGQRVKAYDTGDPFNPVKTIKEISKEKEEALKKQPTAKREKEIEKLKKKLEETEKKLADAQTRVEQARTESAKKGTKKFGRNNKLFTEEKLNKARESLRKKLLGLHAGIDPTAVIELTEIGGYYFEGGLREFGAWSKMLTTEFGNNINPHLKSIWKEVNDKYNKFQIDSSKERIGKRSAKGETLQDISFDVQKIAEALINSGITNRGKLVTEIQSILQESFPDITSREVSDLLSGYGRYKNLSMDSAKRILRDIKGQLQQISKLEDMQQGQAPLKTGVERRAVSDEERRLIKLVEEAKKKYNIKTTDPTTQLKSALDSYKTNLRNQIKDLEKQIAERKKIVKEKTSLSLDKEAEMLIDKKNELRKIFTLVFGKPELSLKQRIRMTENSLNKSIARYEQKIKEGDISPITQKRKPVVTARIEQLRAKRDVLKSELDILRDMAKPKRSAQEIGLQTLKTRLTNESLRLEEKLENMDFEVKQKKEIVLDAEAEKLKMERDRIKASYNAAKYIKEPLTKGEVKKIIELSKEASDAQKKVTDKNDWTADNAEDVEAYFYRKNEFENYVKSLKPVSGNDVVNKFLDYFRASILASHRILRNSFLYQVVPGIERTITKRIVTGAFNDADVKSNIVEKISAKLSGIKPSAKSADFIKRQVAMAIRIYNKTGVDISRMEKMGSVPRYFGERIGKFTGKSIIEKYAKIVNLAPKWLAGGTDMLFANIGRADTSIMMSKEIAKIESLRGILPEGMTEEQRAYQLLKDSYSFNPSDKRAKTIREAGIMDAHMMNNTQPGWWSDKVIEFRRMLKIGEISFGKALIPFAKIANVVVAEGVKTVSGYGIAKSIYDINVAGRTENAKNRSIMMHNSVTNLVRYVGLMGAAILMASFLDDDDYVGAYSTIGKKEYDLAKGRNAGTNYIRIAGKWIPLRYLPMINIPISAIMSARQAKKQNESPYAGYLVGVMGQIMDAPGIREVGTISGRIGYSLKSGNLEKMAKNMKMDWEGISGWAKVRVIPSIISYDVWNALFPKDARYDFMGREIEKTKMFKEDTSNDITIEISRLSDAGQFPTISDPKGKYAILLEEKIGEAKYNEMLAGFKTEYAKEISRTMKTSRYKKSNDEEKKKIINKIRTREISNKIRKESDRIKRHSR